MKTEKKREKIVKSKWKLRGEREGKRVNNKWKLKGKRAEKKTVNKVNKRLNSEW